MYSQKLHIKSEAYSPCVEQGMVFRRGVEGNITERKTAKVAVFSCPFDITTTETKGTVLINTAEQLETFSRGEEVGLEAQVGEFDATAQYHRIPPSFFMELYR